MSDVELTSITLTEAARVYLRELLDRQEAAGMGVRIFVENPGTPRAECCMAYCAPGEQETDDHLTHKAASMPISRRAVCPISRMPSSITTATAWAGS